MPRTVIPYRTKVVEPIQLLDPEERAKRLEKAGNNLFRLRAEDVYIDLLTDSGTGAMSTAQWSRIMLGDESYAGSRSFHRIEESVQDVMGIPYVLPEHQGRAAERVLNHVLIKPHTVVPGNSHFDTTKAHIELAGGRAIDCTIDEGKRSDGVHPFKGNADLAKVRAAIEHYGPKQVAYLLMTLTCNSGGGQPVSMENLKAMRAIADEFGVLLFFDAARFAENAYFIQQREEGYRTKTVRAIVLEMFQLADGFTMSSKKDAIVPMGGLIGVRDERLYEALKTPTIIYEGFFTYGGMSGMIMEALAQGLQEVVEQDYLAHRIGQVAEFGAMLRAVGATIVEPVGGHAVFIDGRKTFPNVPEDQFPAQLLCVELYRAGGVRSVEVGSNLAGRDPDTGENLRPALDLTRLTVPRRVYWREHFEYVADVVREVIEQQSDRTTGLAFDVEAAGIRHFGSTFRYVEKEATWALGAPTETATH